MCVCVVSSSNWHVSHCYFLLSIIEGMHDLCQQNLFMLTTLSFIFFFQNNISFVILSHFQPAFTKVHEELLSSWCPFSLVIFSQLIRNYMKSLCQPGISVYVCINNGVQMRCFVEDFM